MVHENYIVASPPGSIMWVLEYPQSVRTIRVTATSNNITTFTSFVGNGVGSVTMSTDGLNFSAIPSTFTPNVGVYYFRRSSYSGSGVFNMEE